jgi:single-strand DNA-binding protein
MAGYEQTIIIGNLGRDPEKRFTKDGQTAVTGFSVAVTNRWNDRQTGQPQEKTNWYNVSCWGRMADTMDDLRQRGALVKGKQVMVTGTVTARAYTGNDGQLRSSLELRAQNVQLLGNRADDMGRSSSSSSSSSSDYSGGDNYDNDFPPPQDENDIPF